MERGLDIARAVAVLEGGGLVAFPTETVYGLGADASSEAAVARIFAAKGRPRGHPLIVHLAEGAQLDDWAIDVPEAARQLARAAWPGPLTLVLRKGPRVAAAVTGGAATVGLRVPAHPIAQALLRGFGGGVAAPSANRFGGVSPTAARVTSVWNRRSSTCRAVARWCCAPAGSRARTSSRSPGRSRRPMPRPR